MPEVILLKDVENVGERGAVVDVSKGYFRNYLAPRKLAQPATKGALAAVRRSQEAAEKAQEQTGDDGRLFGSVTNQDIADAIQEARGIAVDKRKVHLPDPIKSVGTYQVVVEVAD